MSTIDRCGNAALSAAAPAARPLDRAFVDVLFQDDELVRAEFDALIAASWHTPPPPPPAVPRPTGRPPRWPAAPLPEPPSRSGITPTGNRRRNQRAPPSGPRHG